MIIRTTIRTTIRTGTATTDPALRGPGAGQPSGPKDSVGMSVELVQNQGEKMRILFVCLGNICRSPSAEGVLRQLADRAGLDVTIDSAGTSDWHIGAPPDRRAIRAAKLRGYDLAALRGRQFTAEDFDRFDLILAMDRKNLRAIEALRPAGNNASAKLFLDLIAQTGSDVPDPYYDDSFERMLDLIEAASAALVTQIAHKKERHPDSDGAP